MPEPTIYERLRMKLDSIAMATHEFKSLVEMCDKVIEQKNADLLTSHQQGFTKGWLACEEEHDIRPDS